MSLEQDLYERHFPTFSDAEVASGAGSPVVSVSGRAGVPNVFVLALATQQNRIGPLIMTRTAAIELRALLQRAGF